MRLARHARANWATGALIGRQAGQLAGDGAAEGVAVEIDFLQVGQEAEMARKRAGESRDRVGIEVLQVRELAELRRQRAAEPLIVVE